MAAQQRALVLAAAALLAQASYAFTPLAAPRPRVALPEKSTEAGGFVLFMGWGDDVELKTAMVVSDAASAAVIRKHPEHHGRGRPLRVMGSALRSVTRVCVRKYRWIEAATLFARGVAVLPADGADAVVDALGTVRRAFDLIAQNAPPDSDGVDAPA